MQSSTWWWWHEIQSMRSKRTEVKSLKQLQLFTKYPRRKLETYCSLARCSFCSRQAIFHHFSLTITAVLGYMSGRASLMKSLVLCLAFPISLLRRSFPLILCFLVLGMVPVMIDGWKWPSAQYLLIGLFLRLSDCRVSGAVSANEPKETKSRHGVLSFHHERNFITLVWQRGTRWAVCGGVSNERNDYNTGQLLNVITTLMNNMPRYVMCRCVLREIRSYFSEELNYSHIPWRLRHVLWNVGIWLPHLTASHPRPR
jgi:hypothetical protein